MYLKVFGVLFRSKRLLDLVSVFQDVLVRNPLSVLVQVVLRNDGAAKLCDLGLAKLVGTAGRTYTLCGMPESPAGSPWTPWTPENSQRTTENAL